MRIVIALCLPAHRGSGRSELEPRTFWQWYADRFGLQEEEPVSHGTNECGELALKYDEARNRANKDERDAQGRGDEQSRDDAAARGVEAMQNYTDYICNCEGGDLVFRDPHTGMLDPLGQQPPPSFPIDYEPPTVEEPDIYIPPDL